MEIESKIGSKIRLSEASENVDFGRGLGFNSTDRTVSRRHVSFRLHQDGTTVCFEVNGKNPIWVRTFTNDDIRAYKNSERGELKIGDSFCVSSKDPVWFNLKRIACEEEDDDEPNSKIRYDEAFAEISGIDHDEIETGDISDIDPVKEFNFVVMGHEFDSYPKKMIRDVKNWNWFLEEPDEDTQDSDEEDENSEKKSRKVARKKRKKGGKGDEDDDVWTGESEEDVELIKKSRNDPKPKYSNRSKDKNKKGAGASRSAKDNAKRKATSDDDEDDETLGGFIVDDEDIGEGNGEDDEEEEFEEDEDEDE